MEKIKKRISGGRLLQLFRLKNFNEFQRISTNFKESQRISTLHDQRGYTIIEMLVYIGILAVIAVLVVNSMLSLKDSYVNFKVSRNVATAALSSLDRMTREIRSADTLTGTSTFDLHPGILGLLSGATTTEFYLDGDTLKISENGTEIGALTRDEVSVTNLVFRQLVSGLTEMVRIEMTLESTVGTTTLSKQFYSSAVLRNSN